MEIHLLMVIYLTFAVSISRAQTEPIMETSQARVIIAQGGKAVLPCLIKHLDNRGKYSVKWFGPSSDVISINEYIFTSDRRFTLFKLYPTDWNLMIKGVRSTDSGKYMCQVNTVPVQSKSVFLRVQVPPSIRSSGLTSVKLGSRLTLFCNVTGDPPSTLAWFKDNIALQTFQSEELSIDNVTMMDGGNYRCEAENGIGSGESATIPVDIMFPPTVKVLSSRIGQYKNKDVVVQCLVLSNPKAEVVWYKDHRPISPTWKYRFETYPSSDGSTTHVFKITEVQSWDYGDYICMGSNDIGSQSAMVSVYEMKDSLKVPPTPDTVSSTYRPQTTRANRPPIAKTALQTVKGQQPTISYHEKEDTKVSKSGEDGTTDKISGGYGGSASSLSSSMLQYLVSILSVLILVIMH